jgi:hypothetical protein
MDIMTKINIMDFLHICEQLELEGVNPTISIFVQSYKCFLADNKKLLYGDWRVDAASGGNIIDESFQEYSSGLLKVEASIIFDKHRMIYDIDF